MTDEMPPHRQTHGFAFLRMNNGGSRAMISSNSIKPRSRAELRCRNPSNDNRLAPGSSTRVSSATTSDWYRPASGSISLPGNNSLDQGIVQIFSLILTRRSRTIHSTPAAALPSPCAILALCREHVPHRLKRPVHERLAADHRTIRKTPHPAPQDRRHAQIRQRRFIVVNF